MTLAETIYQKSLSLPEEKAREVLNFIDALQQQPKHTADVHLVDSQNSSLLAVFEKAGLVGCLATDEQLSTNYKTVLDYSQKHGS
jgi:hypothetical protein